MTRTMRPQEWIGLHNYIKAFGDSTFLNSMKVSIIFCIISVAMSVILAVAIAVQLLPKGRYRTFLRACLLFSFSISPALKGFTWRFMLNPQYGVVDRIIGFLIPPLKDLVMLGTPATAMFWLAYTEVWGWAPYMAMIFLGAMNMIEEDVFSSAQMDGANSWQIFRYIKLPIIMPVVSILTLLKTVYSIKMFDQVSTMTEGGPGNATETINYMIYRNGFEYFNMGYSAAQGVILILILSIFAYLYTKGTMRKEKFS